MNFGSSSAEEIAKVVYGEGGIFVGKNHAALVAIAQCVYDEWHSGLFGTDLAKILRNNFYGHSDIVNAECLQAVNEVFSEQKKRFPDEKIYEFRSFAKYSDGCGNLAQGKCADLLRKYDYLGKDSISTKWGHFYFGKANRPYSVQTGAFENMGYADQSARSLKLRGIEAEITYQAPHYIVSAGHFRTYEEAKKYSAELSAKGISNFVVKK